MNTIDKLTPEHLRRWLEATGDGGTLEPDEQGRFVFNLTDEEESLHPICCYAFVDESCLVIDGFTDDYDVPKEKSFECIVALNEYNKMQYPIKAVLEDRRIYFRHTLHVSEPASEEHVMQDGLYLGMLSIKVAVERMDQLLRQVGVLH